MLVGEGALEHDRNNLVKGLVKNIATMKRKNIEVQLADDMDIEIEEGLGLIKVLLKQFMKKWKVPLSITAHTSILV